MNAPFFRIDLSGEKIPFEYEEMHGIRRDILHYFEDDEIAVMYEQFFQKEYWKYLSIIEGEFAEDGYAAFCERGCLALMNGLAAEIIENQLWITTPQWAKAKRIATAALPWLHAYTPSDPALSPGRGFLIASYSFFDRMMADDIDHDSQFLNFDNRKANAWFAKTVIGPYFVERAQRYAKYVAWAEPPAQPAARGWLSRLFGR